MTSCASVKHTKKITEYKELTKDICRDNPNEVLLAQKIYLTYVRN
jgi:hypothetical protein